MKNGSVTFDGASVFSALEEQEDTTERIHIQTEALRDKRWADLADSDDELLEEEEDEPLNFVLNVQKPADTKKKVVQPQPKAKKAHPAVAPSAEEAERKRELRAKLEAAKAANVAAPVTDADKKKKKTRAEKRDARNNFGQ